MTGVRLPRVLSLPTQILQQPSFDSFMTLHARATGMEPSTHVNRQSRPVDRTPYILQLFYSTWVLVSTIATTSPWFTHALDPTPGNFLGPSTPRAWTFIEVSLVEIHGWRERASVEGAADAAWESLRKHNRGRGGE